MGGQLRDQGGHRRWHVSACLRWEHPASPTEKRGAHATSTRALESSLPTEARWSPQPRQRAWQTVLGVTRDGIQRTVRATSDDTAPRGCTLGCQAGPGSPSTPSGWAMGIIAHRLPSVYCPPGPRGAGFAPQAPVLAPRVPQGRPSAPRPGSCWGAVSREAGLQCGVEGGLMLCPLGRARAGPGSEVQAGQEWGTALAPTPQQRHADEGEHPVRSHGRTGRSDMGL